MAASVAACGPNAATPSEENNASNGGATTSKVTARSLDEIKKSGVLKVAVFSDKAPFGYIDKDCKNAATTSSSPSVSPRIWAWNSSLCPRSGPGSSPR